MTLRSREGGEGVAYVRTSNTMLDIAHMPNRDPSVKNGLHSVTTGKVRWGVPRGGGMATVVCERHGAILRVGEKLWRCPTCNEGTYTPDGIEHEPSPPRHIGHYPEVASVLYGNLRSLYQR